MLTLEQTKIRFTTSKNTGRGMKEKKQFKI